MYMYIHLCLFIFNQRQSNSRARIAPSNLPADQECPCPWYSPWQFFLPTRVYKYCAYDCISKGTKDVIYIHVYITTYHTCTQIHIYTCEYLHTHKNILIRTYVYIMMHTQSFIHTLTNANMNIYIHITYKYTTFYTYILVQPNTCVRSNTHTYIHINTFIMTKACAQSLSWLSYVVRRCILTLFWRSLLAPCSTK